jgi:hypothetical protein
MPAKARIQSYQGMVSRGLDGNSGNAIAARNSANDRWNSRISELFRMMLMPVTSTIQNGRFDE